MADRVVEKGFRQRLQNGAALCSVQKIPFMISHKILYTPGRKITNFSGWQITEYSHDNVPLRVREGVIDKAALFQGSPGA